VLERGARKCSHLGLFYDSGEKGLDSLAAVDAIEQALLWDDVVGHCVHGLRPQALVRVRVFGVLRRLTFVHAVLCMVLVLDCGH